MTKNIVAYSESNYRGKYEYRYDPEHKNKPKGEGWYITNHGWARGRNHKVGHIPSQIIQNDSIIKPSPELIQKVLEFSKDENRVKNFVTYGITNNYAASDEVISKLGNHREQFKHFDDLIVDFADKKKKSVSHILSGLMGYLFHLSPDFRNENKPIPEYNQKNLDDIKKYIRNEQEILRMTGLVNDDDTITLFRNTDHNQILGKKLWPGLKISYLGNNFESWTTNPDLKFSLDGKFKITAMAKIPIYACIASCIGRRERPFMFKDKKECEVMVCGAFVNLIRYVGDSLSGIDNEERENYLSNSRFNMQRFANQDRNKKASVSFNRRIAAMELIKIAKALRSN